jgi:hypothetical protein
MLVSDVNNTAAQLEIPTNAARREDTNAKFFPKRDNAV